MQQFECSGPERDRLVRRVAGALLEGTLWPSDIDDLDDRQVQVCVARHNTTVGNTRVSAPAAPA